jgi:hypothetical protein
MRTKRAIPARRRPRAAAVAGLLIVTAVAAAGCSGSSSSSSGAAGSADSAASAPAGSSAGASSSALGGAVPAAGAAGSAAGRSAAGGSAASSSATLMPAGQQIVYTAQLTVRASSVSAAVSRATSIVRAAGGYVAAENATAGQGQPSQGRATVTYKIPAAVYSATLATLSGPGLGTQVSLTQQAQDVTQQVADTSSRVASDQAAISQLRALLKRAGSVSALLSVQNQIDQQTSDLEAMLARQNALDHETAYATVTLTLTGPKAAAKPAQATAPPGLPGGLARGWHAFVLTVSWLLTALGAAAPFLIAVAVVAVLAWWVRRRLVARQQRPVG